MRTRVFQLRTVPAMIREPLATTCMMTAAGKWIHVVQRPHHWQVRRQRCEEAGLINPARSPVQIDHIWKRTKILQSGSAKPAGAGEKTTRRIAAIAPRLH